MADLTDINPLLHEMLRHFKRTGYGEGPCGGEELADYGEAYERIVLAFEAKHAESDELRKAAQAVLDSMTVKDYGEVLPPTLASIERLKDALRRRG